MKEVTNDVIMDLLPLYLAGEVSEETAALVKKHLEADPELAETAKQMAKADSLNKVPIPFKKETAMETYQEAKKWITIRILGLATLGTILIIFLTALFLFANSTAGR
ncbi:MAG: zf-HC2 domain-containing protein [Anaerolineales bacterium]|nr:zf-HC2 domain-containing protein [Anaerolineales bacterium]